VKLPITPLTQLEVLEEKISLMGATK